MNRDFLWFSIIALAGLALRSYLYFDNHIGFFWQDTGRDYCVKPFQYGNGLPVWGGDTAIPMYWILHHWNRIVGLSGVTVHIFQSILILASQFLLWMGIKSYSGIRTAHLTHVFLQIYFPFVIHGIYPTAILWGFLPFAAGVFCLLLARGHAWAAVGSGLATGVSLFCYPGATIGLLSFSFLFFTFSPLRWRARLLSLVVFGTVSALSILGLRSIWTPNRSSSWAGGHFDPSAAVENVRFLLVDTFFEASSWNLLSSGIPYVHWIGLILAILTAGLALPRLSVDQRRIVFLCAGAFAVTFLINGLLGGYPGARRLIFVLPFIVWGGGVSVANLSRRHFFVLTPLWIAAFCLQSWFSMQSSLPLINSSDSFAENAFAGLQSDLNQGDKISIEKFDRQTTPEFFQCRIGYEFFAGTSERVVLHDPSSNRIEGVKFIVGAGASPQRLHPHRIVVDGVHWVVLSLSKP